MNISLKRIREENGFTLVEVLMAMIILMFGILAVASMQVMAMRGNVHSKETTLRTTTADNIMEWLMSHDFDADNLRDSSTVDHILTVDLDTGEYTMSDSDFSDGHKDTAPPANIVPPPNDSNNPINKIQWTVTPIESGTAKIITVIVEWANSTGSTQISNIKPNMD